MYRLLKRNFNLAPTITSLTIASAILVFLCATPWVSGLFGDDMFLGIPTSFLAATLLLPILCFVILWIAMQTAEDIDRHDPRYENE